MRNRAESTRYLDRLRSIVFSGDDERMERLLSATRAALSAVALVAAYIDSPDPPAYADLARTILIVYFIYSVVLALLPAAKTSKRPFQLIIHGIDVIWPTVITLFTAGPQSPFFLFFLFVLISAAYRWGFRETMLTGAINSLILVTEGVVLSLGRDWQGQFEMNRFVVRSTYTLVVAFLLGHLAEEEKQLRAQASVIAKVVTELQAEQGLRPNLARLFHAVMGVFGSSHVVLASQERASGRVFVWRGTRQDPAGDLTLHFEEQNFSERGTYLFGTPGESAHIVRASATDPTWLDIVCLREDGKPIRQPEWSLPERFVARHSFHSLLCSTFELGEEWLGALFLIDPHVTAARETEVRFLQTLIRQVGPAVYSVYLLRRLRSRAGAMERTRVAQELHDGVLQSLIALEMQVDVLRRNTSAGTNGLGAELGGVQEMLHREILNVRELMQQMRPLELRPNQFLDFLSGTVEKFQRETGISARFVTDLEDVSLSPRVGRELARIVQEALVNVRKHSAAHSVVVRFAHANGDWKLLIEDDGHGFDFSGRLSFDELKDKHKGPAIIKERLGSIEGKLAIESRPGHGSRLEITLPQKAYG